METRATPTSRPPQPPLPRRELQGDVEDAHGALVHDQQVQVVRHTAHPGQDLAFYHYRSSNAWLSV